MLQGLVISLAHSLSNDWSSNEADVIVAVFRGELSSRLRTILRGVTLQDMKPINVPVSRPNNAVSDPVLQYCRYECGGLKVCLLLPK